MGFLRYLLQYVFRAKPDITTEFINEALNEFFVSVHKESDLDIIYRIVELPTGEMFLSFFAKKPVKQDFKKSVEHLLNEVRSSKVFSYDGGVTEPKYVYHVCYKTKRVYGSNSPLVANLHVGLIDIANQNNMYMEGAKFKCCYRTFTFNSVNPISSAVRQLIIDMIHNIFEAEIIFEWPMIET